MGNSKVSTNAGVDSTFLLRTEWAWCLNLNYPTRLHPAVGSGSFSKFSYHSSQGRLYWAQRLIFGLYGVGVIIPNIKSGIKWVQLARLLLPQVLEKG